MTRPLTFELRRSPGAKPGRARRAERTYSREELLSAVQRWVIQYGEPPTSADWEPSRARRIGQPWRADRFATGRWPTMRMVRTEFGSLNAAIEAAGHEPRRAPTRVRTQIRDPQEILRAIREWTALYGEPPAMSDWDPSRARRQGHQWRIARYLAGDWPSARTVCSRFGNFREAVLAAGLEPRPQGRHAGQSPSYEQPRPEPTSAPLAGEAQLLGKTLTQRVRSVAEARNAGDAWAIRAALVDLAATALTWAEALGGEHPTNVMEMLAMQRSQESSGSTR